MISASQLIYMSSRLVVSETHPLVGLFMSEFFIVSNFSKSDLITLLVVETPIMKSVPEPSLLLTLIVPPKASTRSLQMLRPRPTPFLFLSLFSLSF